MNFELLQIRVTFPKSPIAPPILALLLIKVILFNVNVPLARTAAPLSELPLIKTKLLSVTLFAVMLNILDCSFPSIVKPLPLRTKLSLLIKIPVLLSVSLLNL